MVGRTSRARENVFFLLKFDLNVVVGLLLPIFRSRSTGGNACFGRGGPKFLQLTEGVFVKVNGVGGNNYCQPKR